MQLALVHTQDSAPRPPAGQPPRSEGFDELLAAVATAQAATTGLVTSATEMTQSTELTARQARLAEQTAEHRQKAADRAATRGADPGSVERGVVRARHERLSAHKADAAEQFRAGEAKFSVADTTSDSRPQSPQSEVLNRPADAEPLRLQNAVEAGAKPAVEAPKLSEQPNVQSVASSRAPASSVVDIASAGRAVADVARTPSPAEAIGRLLAGRAAEPAGRVSAAPPTAGGQDVGQQHSRAAERGTERAGQARDAEASQRSDTTRQADFARIIRALKLQAGTKSSSAVIRLDPPELGRVRIDLRMEEDLLSIRVEAATQKGRELLQSRIRELVESLAEHNIRVGRLEVVAVEDRAGLSGSPMDQSGAAPMQEFSKGSSGEDRRSDRRSDRREDADPAVPDEDELVAALDARLDIRV